MTNWNLRFMELASLYASWSKDPSTKVGAVIVDHDHRPISMGFNGFPRGVNDDPERYLDKETKYKLIVHAEANALLNAITNVRDFTMYTTMFPCSECAKLIVQSGLTAVVCPPARTEGKWAEDAAFSRTLLKEGTVFVREYDGKMPVVGDQLIMEGM